MAKSPAKSKPAAPAASRFSPAMVTMMKRSRFNPISGLTPELLTNQLSAFAVGCLTGFAMTAEAIRRRDDVINPALLKREKAPARRNWTVQIVESLDEAQLKVAEEHKAALQYLYDNLEVTAALEQNLSGGFRLLVRQMMEAVGMRYSVHEIVWKPQIDAVTGKPRLTARFIHAPLWLFENTTGRLRFLSQVFGYEGQPMELGEWLVTVGDGIMEPLAVAYMFKQMSLKDWVSFNDKFGMPGIHAETDAGQDSPEWQAVTDAVEQFSQDWSAVTNRAVKFNLIEAKSGTSLPFRPLVERMDRAIATICRGADLSTISAGQGSGQGASVQGEETDLLEEDDAQMITEALETVSGYAIKYLFGTDTPLAYVQIVVPKRKTTEDTIKKLEFMRDSGARVAQSYAAQELGVPLAADDEERVLTPRAAPSIPPAQIAAINSAVNDATLRQRSLDEILAAKRDAMAPLAARLQEIIGIEDDAEQEAALMKWQADLAGFMREHAVTEQEIAAWMKALGTGLVSGAVEGREKTPPVSKP